MEQGHLYLVLGACADEADIALKVLRLNEELELRSRPKMYAKALDVSAPRSCRRKFFNMIYSASVYLTPISTLLAGLVLVRFYVATTDGSRCVLYQL